MAVNIRKVKTPVLEIAYEEQGDPNGFPVVLIHGFPDDVRAWDETARLLANAGYRVLTPYIRGFGPTRFLSESTLRAGQQAAIGQDLIDFIDALGLSGATLAGYDWGCRAACVASVLQPSRVNALIAIGGYNIQDVQSAPFPELPAEEKESWYHWYFNTERGRLGLNLYKREICRMLWRDWSPGWQFDEETFERTAKSFDNPDFVDVVVQEYRHCHLNDPGDPQYNEIEKYLSRQPHITVPSVILHGTEDTIHPPHRSEPHPAFFPKGTGRILVPGAGHFLPRQRPDAVFEAIIKLVNAHPQ